MTAIHFIRIASLAFLLLTKTSWSYAQDAEAPPSRWEKDIAAFEAQDAASPPAPGGVLFVGSSSIRLWDLAASFPESHALNRGFGGCYLSDVAHFADRIVLPYRPRLIVVYAGDNDLAAGRTPEQVIAAYRELVKTVREKLPETRLALISIKPSLKRWQLIDRIRETNRAVAEIAGQGERLEFIDIEPLLLGPDGQPRPELFRDDGLHLNAAGYQLWTERLRPVLAKAD